MHITGDIAFAARQYIAATGNQDWLLNELGGDLIYETARFWSSRAIYNNEKKQYEILSTLFFLNKFFFVFSKICNIVI
jgi:trehalose/maltose hydrolase-like predicted phosphorylase